ncbi:MAG: hypothetical protein U9Q58_09355, partial [Pseudomonadota bacterium]|nr:hypothetical protein [Pseudomonadota bacterium]
MRIFFDILDYFYRGGILMVPIMLVSVVMWVLILLKLQSVWAVNQRDMGLVEALKVVRERRLVNDF